MPLLSPVLPDIVIPAQAGISLLNADETQVSDSAFICT